MNSKKIAAFAVGPIAGAALGFITLPIITWFFSQEDIGRLAMLNVMVGFCTLFFSLGLDQAYVREFHESKNKPALLKTTLFPGLFLLLIALLLIIGSGNTLSLWLFDLNDTLLSFVVAVVVVCALISRFLSLILRMNEQGLAYSISQALPKLLLLIIITACIVFSAPQDITSLVLANMLAAVFVCLLFVWNTRKEWRASLSERFDYAHFKELLGYSVPLIFGGLAFWGLTAADRIFLKELSDFEQLGLYSVAVSFAAAATIFQGIFTTVWMPTVYKWASTGEGLENIHKVNRYVLLVVIILFCLAGLLSWIVTWFLPENYNSVQWILISCLGFPLLYTLSETTVVGIGVTRRSGFAMLASALAFLINLLGNWYLIPSLGAAGAAVSTCISFWIFLILRTEFAIYLWRPMPRLALYSYTSLLVLGAVINSMFGEDFRYELMFFWLLMLGSVAIFFKGELEEGYSWLYIKLKGNG